MNSRNQVIVVVVLGITGIVVDTRHDPQAGVPGGAGIWRVGAMIPVVHRTGCGLINNGMRIGGERRLAPTSALGAMFGVP
jgi:hypothetical protein